MAQTAAELVLRQSINLSYNDIQKALPDAPVYLIKDLFNKQSNINDLAQISGDVESQVILNTDQIAINVSDISVNVTNISTNTTNIATNTTNIGTNSTNIGTNTTNITANTNAIALANGQLVGNDDFATALVGGVVNLSANVVDAVASTVTVTSPAATDLPTVITLANELSANQTQLVTDLNNAITQLNAFLAANKTAKQMAL